MIISIAVLIVAAGIAYILMTFVFPKFLQADEYEKGTDIVNTSQTINTKPVTSPLIYEQP